MITLGDGNQGGHRASSEMNSPVEARWDWCWRIKHNSHTEARTVCTLIDGTMRSLPLIIT
jgi:hypothetical protein